jgi:hypothetical protein
MLAALAFALAGYLPFGGYDRGGYEYSTVAGHVKFGGYDREGYEYSAALFGHEKFGDTTAAITDTPTHETWARFSICNDLGGAPQLGWQTGLNSRR